MKIVKKIYATLICAIISLLCIVAVILFLPFSILGELLTLFIELKGEEEFYHGVWIKFIKKCVRFIKDCFDKIVIA